MQIPLAARLAAIVIDCATPAVPPDESVTWTVNVKGPAMVGVPEIELADIASGGGRAPELIDQLYGGRPPEAAKEIVGYAIPTSSDGKVRLAMLSGGAVDDGGVDRMVGGADAAGGGVDPAVSAVGLAATGLSTVGEELISATGLGPT